MRQSTSNKMRKSWNMGIRVKNIYKQFGAFTALDDISLDVCSGELVALLGPSGSGKTTLLRIIADLEKPDRGEIEFYGKDAVLLNNRKQTVGFVFQHYALFRHMTVFDNIAFGLNVRPRKFRPSANAIREKVSQLLHLVKLEHFSQRYPAQLSGGQRQRVALARALAIEPRVLLLDEPFGSLDAKVRKELRRWLRHLHDEIKITSIFVTHDQEEALELADRVVIMNDGQIIQIGSADEVYHQPATPFVLKFLGDVNFFHCRKDEDEYILLPEDDRDSKAVEAFARPHALEISLETGGENSLPAKVSHINPAGPMVKVELTGYNGSIWQASISQKKYRILQLKTGMSVFIRPTELKTFKY
jgi:sulfate transport system ATP-binding protein